MAGGAAAGATSSTGAIIGGAVGGGVGLLLLLLALYCCCCRGGAAAGKRRNKKEEKAAPAAAGVLALRAVEAPKHDCGQAFALAVTWVGGPLPPPQPAFMADGSPAPPHSIVSRANVCPHTSLRAMGLAVAKAYGLVPADYDAASDKSMQFYVAVNGGAELWTAEATGAVTAYGITAAAARGAAAHAAGKPGGAPLTVTLRPAPAAPVIADADAADVGVTVDAGTTNPMFAAAPVPTGTAV
jgi:hypothetical protein